MSVTSDEVEFLLAYNRMKRAERSVLDLSAPALSTDRASTLLHERWGLTPSVLRPLPSERDYNVMVDDKHVFKVSNEGEPRAAVEMEVIAGAHIASVAPDISVPSTLSATSGSTVDTITDDNGIECLARVITRVPGTVIEGHVITADLAEQVGGLASRASVALQGLFHPAAGRQIDWDVRRAADVLMKDRIIEQLGDVGRTLRHLIPQMAAAAGATHALPSGLHHADVTLTNVLADGGEITGLIDFGDMHHTASVCDLAVCLTSVLRNTAANQPLDVWQLTEAVLVGYQRHRLLCPAEVAVLGDLVLSRLGVTLAISARRQITHAGNAAYIGQHDKSSTRVLDELARLPSAELADRMARLAGTLRSPSRVVPTAENDLIARRDRVMGGQLSPLFYRRPLEIVRGEGPWLIDRAGRRYLDAYNNVAVLGHAHPAVTQAIGRQLAELNTNSRYLHAAIVELAERLIDTVPAELDTCLFTTSGTEANDLAWRMATAYTAGTGAVIVEHAYHGSSKWLTDLSSADWPPGYRPPHVATFTAPGLTPTSLTSDAATAGIQAAADELLSNGDRVALVLADSAFTSEGIRDAPDEFFAGLVAGAHRNGALYLADEVQCGYHRSGHDMWLFPTTRITPDFVTLGKPMGAGYPMGAVLTRREIADSLARNFEYFSTFAATPAAAVAGLTVLDFLQQHSIPAAVESVGDYLRHRLADLNAAQIGEIRGRGLLVGLELLTPDDYAGPNFAQDVLSGLLDRGVLAGVTGRRRDVLKLRPPLIWRSEHVDRFTATLRSVLG